MAERAETSVMYLYQIGTGFRGASTEKAELIENATNNELTKMQVLYPYD